MKKYSGWELDHMKVVANRCAQKFVTAEQIERYLSNMCCWEPDAIKCMISYLRRSNKI